MGRKYLQLRSSKRFALSQRKKHSRSSIRASETALSKRMKMLKVEMEGIGKDQERIRKGQREVKAKFEKIELECEQLRGDTNLIIQQSVNTQFRLCLMFQILKARENNDFTKAAGLTQILREVIAK